MIAIPDQLPTDPSTIDPTPEEIAQRAAAIRSRWSNSQRRRRRITADRIWLPPTVHIADLEANIPSVQNN